MVGIYLHDLLADTAYRQAFLERLGWSGATRDWGARIDAELDACARLIDTSGWGKALTHAE